MRRVVRRVVPVLACAVLLRTAPLAQGSGATIVGVVKDTSGAVLPGVSVDLTSPALSGLVGSAVTDGTGRYRIVALRPGAYTLTARLTGFNTFERRGLEVWGAGVFTVNAELKVGTIERTLPVDREMRVVDLQSMSMERVMSAEVLVALPTTNAGSQRSFAATYLLDEIQSVEGDLVQMLFRAPQSFIHIKAKDENGVMRRWSVEWGAALQLNRQGVTRDTLKPGDHVIVTGHPGRNAEDRRLLMRSITRPKDGWKWGGSFDFATGGLGVLVPRVSSVR